MNDQATLHRPVPTVTDDDSAKRRHIIENFFGKRKECKRIAMRAYKTYRSSTAMTHIAAAVFSSR